jgi:hypothetical protein
MLRSCALTLTGLACLACSQAHASDEPRLEPGLHVEIPFGGPRGGSAGGQFVARLDYRAGEGGIASMPAALQWRLNGAYSAVELMGLPLVVGAGYRAASGEDATGTKVAKAVGMSMGATLAIGGLAVWALTEALDGFGEDLSEAVVEHTFGAGGDGEGDGTGTPAEPCTGVQVGDECISTSGGGG